MEHTSVFPISDKAFPLGAQLLFFSAGLSTNAVWSSSALWEAPMLNKSVSLLVHLVGAQPHDVPQLPLVARHLHFSVLHKDFLLHEQHTLDPVFPVTSACSSTGVPVFKRSESLVLNRLDPVPEEWTPESELLFSVACFPESIQLLSAAFMLEYSGSDTSMSWKSLSLTVQLRLVALWDP